MNELKNVFVLGVCVVALLIFIAPSNASDELPIVEPGKDVLRVQKKADEMFEEGKYERAYFIFKEDLAPIGDKYAQYMIGYMHLTGRGVPQDVIAASAWYRLAAERDNPAFKDARDEVMSLLNERQKEQSNTNLTDLLGRYGDASILCNLIEQDIETLRRFTMSNPNLQRDLRQPFDNRRHVYVPVAEQLGSRVEALIEANLSQEIVSPKEQDRVDAIIIRAKNELERFIATP